MFDGLLTLSFIVPVYFAAFAILRLEKHWHRTAEALFTFATLLTIVLLVLWVWNNPDGLRGGIAFTVAIAVIVMNIWFVRKVETYIDSERPRLREANGNRLLTESQSPVVSEPDRQAQEAALEAAPQEEQAIPPLKPFYDRFLNHPASLGLPEKTYLFFAGPEDAPLLNP